MSRPLFRKIDCYMVRANDLDDAVAFYGERLGRSVLWRTDEAVAFGFPESDAEIVVHTHHGPEVDLLVDNADRAYLDLIAAGATSITPPFDITIGRCAVVKDPFDNLLVVLDQSKGQLAVNSESRVIGVQKPSA